MQHKWNTVPPVFINLKQKKPQSLLAVLNCIKWTCTLQNYTGPKHFLAITIPYLRVSILVIQNDSHITFISISHVIPHGKHFVTKSVMLTYLYSCLEIDFLIYEQKKVSNMWQPMANLLINNYVCGLRCSATVKAISLV